MTSTTLSTVIDGGVALVVIAASTVLLALHDISEPTALAIFGVGITLVGGSAKALLALKVPAPTQTVTSAAPVPPTVV